jgi:hypothetical protein
MTDDDIEAIIRHSKSGFKLVRSPDVRSQRRSPELADAIEALDLDALKARYLPANAVVRKSVNSPSALPGGDVELIMGQLEPEEGLSSDPDGPGRKSIIIDPESKRIVGEQG